MNEAMNQGRKRGRDGEVGREVMNQ